jgi:hypothetical protein
MFRYLSAKVLDEGSQDIHELELGHHVFGRPIRYDTTADNIVRVHASMLRKRLSEYFAAEGREEPFIIEIPRGNYAPLFRKRDSRDHGPLGIETVPPHFTLAASPVMEGVPGAPVDLGITAEAVRPVRWMLWISSGLAIAFALLSAVLFIRLQRAAILSNSDGFVANGAVRQFWSQIFGKDDNVDVVLDDASLEFYQQTMGHPIPLAEYFDRSYLQSVTVAGASTKLDPALVQALVLRRQSNYADAVVVWDLAKIATTMRSKAQVQFARDVSFRQVKLSNLVLLGNPESDPWIQLFENDLSLQWRFDPDSKTSYPVDISTPADQNKFRAAAENSKTREGYATVSFLPNLNGTGDVLIVSGTGGAAIDAAMEWLLDPSSMSLLQSRLDTHSHQFPYFETLLKIEKGTRIPRNVSIAICRTLRVTKSNASKSVPGL